MSKERNLSPFFKRRIDHHKFEKMMRKGIIYMYYESKSVEEFKYKLVKATLENYIHYKYNIDIEDLPHDDVDNFIDYMVEVYDPVLKMYYYNERKNRGDINESNKDKLSKDTMIGTFQDIVDQTLEEIKNYCENKGIVYDGNLSVFPDKFIDKSHPLKTNKVFLIKFFLKYIDDLVHGVINWQADNHL